ncbi:MAG: hypothetical protein AB3N33_01095 [Puniceicoccaceae bacterium]
MRPTLPPLTHPWMKCITVGTAYELLREDMRNQLRFLQKTIGYEFIRFHCTFHDHLAIVMPNEDGSVRYCWALFDKVYDFLMEVGLRPIMELNPMPDAIASGDTKWGYYQMNVTPPKSMEAWEDLVSSCVEHCIERYGQNEVLQWHFEVWNEPNLKPFWTGTMEEYFELYAASARAVKGVDPRLTIGGPATAGGKGCGWIMPLLEYCKSNEVPVDFITFHNYAQGEYCTYHSRVGSPHEPGMAFTDEFKETKEALVKAGYADMPIYITEWNAQHCGDNGRAQWVGNNDCSRLLGGASAIFLATETEPYVDMLGYWTASDIRFEPGMTNQPYGGQHQHTGLLTINGLPKPIYHAFKWLSRMQGPRYEIEFRAKPRLGRALVTHEIIGTHLLAWNMHVPDLEANPYPTEVWQETVTIPMPETFADGTVVELVIGTLKEREGSAYECWGDMDEPHSLTRMQHELLESASQPGFERRLARVVDGAVAFHLHLGRDEVVFVQALRAGREVATGNEAFRDDINASLDYSDKNRQ